MLVRIYIAELSVVLDFLHRSHIIYRDVKVMMIGGGSEEIMKDLAARQLGL